MFQVPGLQNPPKIDANTHSKKYDWKIDFGLRFGFPKPSKMLKKSKKNAAEALSKVSRKKQAPGITDQGRDSPESQAFWLPAGPSNHPYND